MSRQLGTAARNGRPSQERRGSPDPTPYLEAMDDAERHSQRPREQAGVSASAMRAPNTGTFTGCAIGTTGMRPADESFHSSLGFIGARVSPASAGGGGGVTQAARGSRGRARPGSRGGRNPPIRFVLPGNEARVSAYHAATAPSAVLPSTTEDTINQILAGSTLTDFSRQQHAPRGTAMLNRHLIELLWNWNAEGRKPLHQQRESLTRADVFSPKTWPVFAGKEGIFHETQTMVGSLRLVKTTRDAGSIIPSSTVLPWIKDGQFK